MTYDFGSFNNWGALKKVASADPRRGLSQRCKN